MMKAIPFKILQVQLFQDYRLSYFGPLMRLMDADYFNAQFNLDHFHPPSPRHLLHPHRHLKSQLALQHAKYFIYIHQISFL